jgi:large subunit ribosomal protein L25
MSETLVLVAENRTDTGKGASRRLRRSGKVPAILYGGKTEPRALMLDHEVLLHQLENEAFYSSILTVTVGDKSQPCILKDLNRHPAKRLILHVDLQRVLEDQEIRVSVPIHFTNEDVCVGVKDQGGAISHLMTEIEVSCLPRNLPEYLEVDMGAMELDQVVLLSQIPLPEGVALPELVQERDHPLASVHIIHEMVVEEEVEEEIEEEGELAEGEEAAAGEDDQGSAGAEDGDKTKE